MKHTLTLTRGSDTAALYHSDTPTDGKVDIINISWHINVSDSNDSQISDRMRSIIEHILFPALLKFYFLSCHNISFC